MTDLFRAHSSKYLTGTEGIITNPNLHRVRRPRDIPIGVHLILNQWFVDRFGVGYRETAMFCTGDKAVAEGYRTTSSTVIRLDPVAPYSLCFSEQCKDLFSKCQFSWLPKAADADEIRSDMDSFNYIHVVNGGLSDAAKSGNEVMVYASKFRYNII